MYLLEWYVYKCAMAECCATSGYYHTHKTIQVKCKTRLRNCFVIIFTVECCGYQGFHFNDRNLYIVCSSLRFRFSFLTLIKGGEDRCTLLKSLSFGNLSYTSTQPSSPYLAKHKYIFTLAPSDYRSQRINRRLSINIP